MDKSYMPIRRKNMDVKVNNNGSHVIDICKTLGLAIVNGRLGDDNGIGNFTCFNKNGGCSTIDYAIVSHELFYNIQNFQVDLFDKCLSDVHCPIVMTLQSTHTHNQEIHDVNTICDSSKPRYMSFKWDRENANEYSDRLHRLTLQLSGIVENIHGNVSQELVDHCYSEICNSFLQAAQDIGVCKWKQSNTARSHKEQHNVNSPSQLWFDADCEAARKEYLNLRNRLSRKIQLGRRLDVQVTDINVLQSDFLMASKKYKKLLRYKRRRHGKDFSASLRSLKKQGNPRAFWDLLNSNGRRTKSAVNVSLGDLVQHFKSLGNVCKSEDNLEERMPLDADNVTIQNDGLNEPITLEEVELMVNKLKNAKACGKDLIRNEFLKSCPLEMRRVIVDLFNIVLDSGIVPSEWCIGVIIPIFKNKGENTNPDSLE
ncbi:uncharacterized protein LOC115923141 [Strongylocentrotus purpuratus]|uniref:Uncharacterized protein n=1 Tax=Strongylocentrotus purpuratus TaxID=7668 RepID=A0A7M7NQV3_STRPU|nr:uncharacterized protein LOC115923141 [Strongylocentrotus purpuratus]